MQRKHWVAGWLMALGALSAQAAEPVQPPRWINADDVRVRNGPSAEHRIIGALLRGAELILKAPEPDNGFCFIEGEGQFGYVACKFLSAERVQRRRAGEGGVDAAQRWASGNGVTVREAPRADAAVVDRLALNAVVKLVRSVDGGYCEVQPAAGAGGFTACRYLAVAPVVVAHVQGIRYADAPAPAGFDPVRAFWLSPGWDALTSYATHLKAGLGAKGVTGPWPRDDELEKMKAHLALGLKGSRPEPYADWADLKRQASQDLDLSGEVRRLNAQGLKAPDAAWKRQAKMEGVARQLQHHLGLWGLLHESISIEGHGAIRNIRLVRALEFPAIRPSLFRSDADLAPPNATTEAVSGRFGIVYRQLVSARPKSKEGAGEGGSAGLYDMLDHTSVLVRSVQRVQLFRDGRLKAEPSLARTKEILRWDADGPMCEGWTPGFSFGDAHPSMRPYLIEAGGPVNVNVSGRLFAFLTPMELPRGAATASESKMTLNREETGFVGGTSLYYDLDGDGIHDLAVWEGEGFGPGHLGGPTTTNDRWYRLAMVNINGQWKVLGSDVFGYGCGC